MAGLHELVVKGPGVATGKVVRWRCADLLTVVKQRFSAEMHENLIGTWLHRLGLRRLQPRPLHPKKNPGAGATFKKLRQPVRAALLGTTAATPAEIWFNDEAKVSQKRMHAYIWTPIGSRPLMPRDNRHNSANIFGAICPARGTGAAVIMPAANAGGMSAHLKDLSTQVTPGSIAVVIRDGAGWHQHGSQPIVPDTIRLLTLPPDSPDLNPMENVWDYPRRTNCVPRFGTPMTTYCRLTNLVGTG